VAGEFAALVTLAQATQDAAERQVIMDQIAAIAPMAGGDGTPRADAAAAPILDAIRTGRLAAPILARIRAGAGHAPAG
jgi:hypothetical protein